MSSDNKNNDSKVHLEADEKDLLLNHSYDGIHELNHPLPKWWNFIFYMSIAFGVLYCLYYWFLGGPNLAQEQQRDMAHLKIIQDEYNKANSAFSMVRFEEFNKPENIEKGLAIYTDNCVQCHLEEGRGDVGPNLTDDHWIHGKGIPETNYEVVYKGFEEKGMPAWGEVLSSDDIYLTLVYLNSFKNTFHKNGKAVEGERVVEEKSL